MAAAGAETAPLRYTPEVKALVVHVLGACREQAAPGHHAKQESPLRWAASLTGVHRDTIAAWAENVDLKGEVPEDHRGGDRRSVDALEPDVAEAADEIIRMNLAMHHAHGSAVTVQQLLQALAEHAEIAPFFTNHSAVERFLHRHGIDWRKSDKYDYLKSTPNAVARRHAYIFHLIQNR